MHYTSLRHLSLSPLSYRFSSLRQFGHKCHAGYVEWADPSTIVFGDGVEETVDDVVQLQEGIGC